MTPEALTELNRKIAVMEASKTQEIEILTPDARGRWCKHCDVPRWNWETCDYRVKPDEPRIVFVHTNCDGSVSTRCTSAAPPIPSIPFVEMTLAVREKLNL